MHPVVGVPVGFLWDLRHPKSISFHPHPSTHRPNITRVGMLRALKPDGSAHFADGAVAEHIDTVIYCTGYK